MSTVGRIGFRCDRTSVLARSRGTPAAVRAMYRSVKPSFDMGYRPLYFTSAYNCGRSMQLVVFLLAWFIFTFGPGIAITGRLTRDLDPLRRIVIALGAGTAAAPVLINLLGRFDLEAGFPA